MESWNMACVPTFRLIAGPVRTPEQSPHRTDLNCSKSREQFSYSIVLKIRQPMRVAPVRSSNGVLCAISASNLTKGSSIIGK
jgi:hypothetical protein